MKTLQYIGAHDGAEVLLPNGRRVDVPQEGTQEFLDEIADGLLAQGTDEDGKQVGPPQWIEVEGGGD